jgi:hypothetical protein
MPESVSLRKKLRGMMDPSDIDIECAQEIAERLSEHFGIESELIDVSDLQNYLRLMVDPAPIAFLGEDESG